MLSAISPIDGRYHSKVSELSNYFSEQALIKYRVKVEVEYYIFLCGLELKNLPSIEENTIASLRELYVDFTEADGQAIKDIEKTTNHDVKAVEYFLKEKMAALGLESSLEYIHFGLTSQDINNTAFPLMIKDALVSSYLPAITEVVNTIEAFVEEFQGIPLLARTHGQPASPTTLGKEFKVFSERVNSQLELLNKLPIKSKFGGATGNINAHKVTFPDKNWIALNNNFIESIGLERMQTTTQIAHYDHLAAIFDNIKRINTILIDFCRDIWTYISMDYFKQKVIANEVGSSAMPHKVNPIDFENAEGNLGMANAIFAHLTEKLPISRLQRDLTDSTVLRNVGVPFAHTLIACKSIIKGSSKLLLNKPKLEADLDTNWAVVAEAIQNIMRREGYPKPYEALKSLTRGKASIGKADIHTFIESLDLSKEIKAELLAITPFNYIGYY